MRRMLSKDGLKEYGPNAALYALSHRQHVRFGCRMCIE